MKPRNVKTSVYSHTQNNYRTYKDQWKKNKTKWDEGANSNTNQIQH